MKRFIVVLSGLLMLPAFAEVAPVYYDDFVEYSDDFVEETEPEEMVEQSAPAQKTVVQRSTANRSTSRAIANTKTAGSSRANTPTRVVASARNTQKSSRAVTSRATKKSSNGRVAVTSRLGKTSKPVTARISTTGSVLPVAKGTTSNYSVKTLENNTNGALYNGTSIRRATARLSTVSAPQTTTTTTLTESDVSNTASNLEAIAELTEYCKTQYAACMDNYCNVLDDNQGRCSCSKNIKNYANTEAALEKATEEFQDTVQKIKYIGLSADQITSLFKETEAELTMNSIKEDDSTLKKSLDNIKDKILLDASSPKASSSYSGNLSMDVSGLFNIDLSSGFDLGSFMNMESNSSANSVSNQRGEQLYKTASNRCKTSVLNSCTAQGIDANIITNSYDLEIDKQCIAYERSLNDANYEMRTNARNAATILQQARLMLAQNKNAYDLRGCVAAMDSCMQDDYVCGSDYELCLDPSGKYLADGAIVKGGTPGISGGHPKNETEITPANIEDWTSGGMYELYGTWNYTADGEDKNAWGGGVSETLGEYIDNKLGTWEASYASTSTTPSDIATYLLQKIGYIDADNKVHGMCASVMQQCQNYTFEAAKSSRSSGFKPNNEVVRQYLASTLSKIKLQQDAILADYAEDCRSDVSSCLSTNGYDEQNPDTPVSKRAISSCRADIVTCMSVSGQKPKDSTTLTLRAMKDWVASILVVCPVDYYLHDDGEGAVTCEHCRTLNGVPTESDGGQVSRCSCPDGYRDVINNDGELTGCTPITE